MSSGSPPPPVDVAEPLPSLPMRSIGVAAAVGAYGVTYLLLREWSMKGAPMWTAIAFPIVAAAFSGAMSLLVTRFRGRIVGAGFGSPVGPLLAFLGAVAMGAVVKGPGFTAWLRRYADDIGEFAFSLVPVCAAVAIAASQWTARR